MFQYFNDKAGITYNFSLLNPMASQWIQKLFKVVQTKELEQVKDFIASHEPALLKQARGTGGMYCTHVAAASGNTEVFKYLVQQMECDPHLEDDLRNDSLFTAVAHGKVQIVEYLLKIGGFDVERVREGLTALFIAASNGDVNMTKCLLSNKADTQTISVHGKPLIAACAHLHLPVVKLLLESKANPNYHSNSRIPLEFAVQYNRPDLLKLLISFQANPNATNSKGMPILHLTALSHNSFRLTQMLVQAGADPSLEYDGSLAWKRALNNQNYEAASFLRQLLRKIDIKPYTIEQTAQGMEKALNLKQEGNQRFRNNQFKQAIQLYKQGLTHASNSVLLSNISACYYKLGQFQSALLYSLLCKTVDPKSKGAYREGLAFKMLKQFAQATLSFWQALQIDPSPQTKKQFQSMVNKLKY